MSKPNDREETPPGNNFRSSTFLSQTLFPETGGAFSEEASYSLPTPNLSPTRSQSVENATAEGASSPQRTLHSPSSPVVPFEHNSSQPWPEDQEAFKLFVKRKVKKDGQTSSRYLALDKFLGSLSEIKKTDYFREDMFRDEEEIAMSWCERYEEWTKVGIERQRERYRRPDEKQEKLKRVRARRVERRRKGLPPAGAKS